MRSRVLLALLLLPLTGPTPARAEDGARTATSPPTSYVVIPNQLLDLPEGDRLALGSPDGRRIMAQRYDAATGAWSPPALVWRRADYYCGDLRARSSASGAVALIALCDRGGYAEDNAPTGSHAIYSADSTTWVAQELDGEAYEEPGVSPGGGFAVWPLGGGRYLTYHAGRFTPGRVAARGQEYTETAVVADDGAVSYAYGGTLAGSRGCGLVVLTRTGTGPVSRQQLRSPLACADVALSNGDADTLILGDAYTPAEVATYTRPGPGQPFALTGRPAIEAPGLARYPRSDTRGIAARFLTAPGLPLVAVGSPDRRRIQVQTYLPAEHRWTSPRVVYRHRVPGCSWSDTASPLGVLVADVTCFPRHRDRYPRRGPANGHRVIASTDGATWHVLRLGKHPLGYSPDGQYVAVPGRAGTTILSRERGALRLPLPAPGRCDLVIPGGPDAAALLAPRGRRDRGWPVRLSVSGTAGWQPRGRVLPRPNGRCGLTLAPYAPPFEYVSGGGVHGYFFTVGTDAGRWVVRRR